MLNKNIVKQFVQHARQLTVMRLRFIVRQKQMIQLAGMSWKRYHAYLKRSAIFDSKVTNVSASSCVCVQQASLFPSGNMSAGQVLQDMQVI